MKSFASMSRELYEAKFKLPKRHKELKVDSIKSGGKNYTITYTQMGRETFMMPPMKQQENIYYITCYYYYLFRCYHSL